MGKGEGRGGEVVEIEKDEEEGKKEGIGRGVRGGNGVGFVVMVAEGQLSHGRCEEVVVLKKAGKERSGKIGGRME